MGELSTTLGTHFVWRLQKLPLPGNGNNHPSSSGKRPEIQPSRFQHFHPFLSGDCQAVSMNKFNKCMCVCVQAVRNHSKTLAVSVSSVVLKLTKTSLHVECSSFSIVSRYSFASFAFVSSDFCSILEIILHADLVCVCVCEGGELCVTSHNVSLSFQY